MERQALNTKGFQRLPDVIGEDATDTALLRAMATSAWEYITSFDWCPPIKAAYLASGVGGVVAIFLFEFTRKIRDTDDSPPDAMERYCSLMEDWIAAIRNSRPLDHVFPVAAAPTPENAESLEKRISFLLAEIIPPLTAMTT